MSESMGVFALRRLRRREGERKRVKEFKSVIQLLVKTHKAQDVVDGPQLPLGRKRQEPLFSASGCLIWLDSPLFE